MTTNYSNFSHVRVTHPFAHKSACFSPFQLARFVPHISFVSRWRQKVSKQSCFALCCCYFESSESSSAFLLLTAARAANMTALINNQLEWESPVSTERHRCTLRPSEYKQHSMKRLLCQWFPLLHFPPPPPRPPPPPPPCTSPPSLKHSSKTEQKGTQKLLLLELFLSVVVGAVL